MPGTSAGAGGDGFRGQILVDLQGAEKQRLRIDDLLGRFEEIRRADLLDETAADDVAGKYV